TFIKALDTDLDYVHDHTRLLTRAIEWDANSRDNSFVLRGNDLKDAEQWLIYGAAKEPKPTQLQTQYIFAGRKAATSAQRKLLIGVTGALVVSVVLGLVALYLYRVSEFRRKIALSRQLAAQAANQLDSRLDLALLLSVEAERSANTLEA